MDLSPISFVMQITYVVFWVALFLLAFLLFHAFLLRAKGPKYLFPAICVLLFGLQLSLATSQAPRHTPDIAVNRRATFPPAEALDQIYLPLADKSIKHVVVGPFFDGDRARTTFPDFASDYFPEAPRSRSDLPAVPPWFTPADPFLGLFVGSASDVEPIVSGVKPLPEGLQIAQVIRVPQVINSSQPIIAFSYTRRPIPEAPNKVERVPCIG